jgi:hypothetical protein
MEKFNIPKPEEEKEDAYLKSLLETIDNLLQDPQLKGKTKEQIREKIENLYNKREELINMIIERGKSHPEKRKEYFNKIFNFAEKLKNKHSRDICLQYLAWHMISGSTPSKKEIKFFDFEGEDSIVNFVNDFYNELIEENKEKDN